MSYMGHDFPVLFRYKECAIRMLHRVGFWRIQESTAQTPFLYMGLVVPNLLKYKECAKGILLHSISFLRMQDGF